eukprot:GILI01011861.1.p1 GENE.GILI01011861.1~~GILI01011861.1.p1  ORF type:complete len:395 (+),score=75.27 GILI01011861.1:90-1274(+)
MFAAANKAAENGEIVPSTASREFLWKMLVSLTGVCWLGANFQGDDLEVIYKETRKIMKHITDEIYSPIYFFPSLGELNFSFKRAAMSFFETLRSHVHRCHVDNSGSLVDHLVKLAHDLFMPQPQDEAVKAFMQLFLPSAEKLSATLEWCLIELCRNPHLARRLLAEYDSLCSAPSTTHSSTPSAANSAFSGSPSCTTTASFAVYSPWSSSGASSPYGMSSSSTPTPPSSDKEFLVKSGTLSMDAINKMKFLDNFVREVLRLHPPTITIIREAVEEVDLGGLVVKKGTMVGTAVHALHRDPKVFSNPDVCDPDRWDNMDLSSTLVRYQFLPFGIGPRHCLGAAFSQVVLKVSIISILRNYDLSLSHNDFKPVGLLVGLPSPMPLVLTPKAINKSE